MISINLIKGSSKIKIKKKSAISLQRLAVLLLKVIVVLALIAGIGVAILSIQKNKRIPHKPIEVVDDYEISTSNPSKAVEDIVSDKKENNDALQNNSGMLMVDYDHLSPLEQINYEIQFAKNVFDLLGKTAVPQVDFKYLEFSHFKSIRGKGVSPSQEKVTELFANLRNQKVQIKPKPLSEINPYEKGFDFTITADVNFGLNMHSQRLVTASNMLTLDQADQMISAIVEIAQESGIALMEKPKNIQTVAQHSYRRFHYQSNMECPYPNLLLFVNTLYKRGIPVAFENLTIEAKTKEAVQARVNFILTTTYQ